ncbi:MAG: LTA synthase family protein, partial [Bacteroidota bacterium]
MPVFKSFPRFIKGHAVAMVLLRLLLVMSLFTVCRVLFYCYNADLFTGMDPGRMVRILAGGLRFDLTAVLYLNALFLVLSLIPLRIRFHPVCPQATQFIFLITNLAGLAVNIADMVYYRTTLRRTTLSILDQFEHENNLGALGIRFMFDYWPATLSFLVLAMVLYYMSARLKTEGPGMKNPWMFYGSGTIGFAIMIGLFIAGVRGGFRHSTRPITVSNAAAYATLPEDVYLVVNTPFSLIRTATTEVIRKVDYFPTEEALERVYTPVHRPSPASAFRPTNVVVIILESFSMEFSGYLNRWVSGGGYQGYTPFLDSLMQQGVTWQYAFANGRKSIDAMPSVLCSIPSIEVPFVLSHYSNNQVNSVASLLKPRGYSSAFFHGAPNGSMGFDAFARQAGFDRYYGMTEYGNDEDMDGMWGIWDLEFLQYASREMGQLPEPCVASVFTVSSHHPFQVPERVRGK